MTGLRSPARSNGSDAEAHGRVGARARSPFAMVPEQIICSDLDSLCFRIYAYLDLRQGARGWPVQGYGVVADALGLQPRTVSCHVAHLVGAGLVRVRRDPGRPRSRAVIEVAHNPARSRVVEQVQLASSSARVHRQSLAPARFEGAVNVARGDSGAPSAPCEARNTRLEAQERHALDAPRPRSSRSGGEVSPTNAPIRSGQCARCGGWPGVDAPPSATFCRCGPGSGGPTSSDQRAAGEAHPEAAPDDWSSDNRAIGSRTTQPCGKCRAPTVRVGDDGQPLCMIHGGAWNNPGDSQTAWGLQRG